MLSLLWRNAEKKLIICRIVGMFSSAGVLCCGFFWYLKHRGDFGAVTVSAAITVWSNSKTSIQTNHETLLLAWQQHMYYLEFEEAEEFVQIMKHKCRSQMMLWARIVFPQTRRHWSSRRAPWVTPRHQLWHAALWCIVGRRRCTGAPSTTPGNRQRRFAGFSPLAGTVRNREQVLW